MRETVRCHLAEAVAGYEDRPREQWVLDYPAQVALTGSQIWWTTDLGIVFERLEEGFETALKDYHKKQVMTEVASKTDIYFCVSVNVSVYRWLSVCPSFCLFFIIIICIFMCLLSPSLAKKYCVLELDHLIHQHLWVYCFMSLMSQLSYH